MHITAITAWAHSANRLAHTSQDRDFLIRAVAAATHCVARGFRFKFDDDFFALNLEYDFKKL